MKDSERVYFLCVLTLLFRHQTDNWKRFKWSSLIPCVNLRFCWLILSHMCVPLCFRNFLVHGTIFLHLVHIMLPLVYSRVNIWITKLRIGGIDFQELCLFITCFWYLFFLWKGSQYLSQCHLKHKYFFHFCNEKLLKYSFMLDVFDQLEIR